MLAIPLQSSPPKHCRRSFLRIGTIGGPFTSLSLGDLLRAEVSSSNPPPSHKAIIHITLGGGPPHQDMWDLKPGAPVEIRGEFKPIKTSASGLEICELFPKLSRLAHRFALLRSVVGAEARHDTFQCLSGWKFDDMSALGGRPCLGATVSKLLGPVDLAVSDVAAELLRALKVAGYIRIAERVRGDGVAL